TKTLFDRAEFSFAQLPTVLPNSVNLASPLDEKRAPLFRDRLGHQAANWHQLEIARPAHQTSFPEAQTVTLRWPTRDLCSSLQKPRSHTPWRACGNEKSRRGPG